MSKKNAFRQVNVFGLPFYCSAAKSAVSVIFKQIKDFYNPEWGLRNTPTVVMTASIVFGGIVACLLQYVRERDAPYSLKNDVFNLSLSAFGSEGPRTCHPFAHELDIVDAVFVELIALQSANLELGLQQASFTVTDPLNPDVSTTATLRDLK